MGEIPSVSVWTSPDKPGLNRLRRRARIPWAIAERVGDTGMIARPLFRQDDFASLMNDRSGGTHLARHVRVHLLRMARREGS